MELLSGCAKRLETLAISCALALAVTLPAVSATPSEYQVKAVFLFNFTQFIEWPARAFADPTAPLIIGVLGNDPFGTDLDDVVRNEVINGRPLVVRRFARVEEIRDCHILFISRPSLNRLDYILKALNGRSILLVSDGAAFAAEGGMVQFFNDRNRIRLRINLDAAQAVGLTISSKLLRPAELVHTRRGA